MHAPLQYFLRPSWGDVDGVVIVVAMVVVVVVVCYVGGNNYIRSSLACCPLRMRAVRVRVRVTRAREKRRSRFDATRRVLGVATGSVSATDY